MAQKPLLAIAVYKAVRPDGATTIDTGSASTGATTNVMISEFGGSYIVLPVVARTGSASTNDSLFILDSGWKFWATQESADTISVLSATDMTTS